MISNFICIPVLERLKQLFQDEGFKFSLCERSEDFSDDNNSFESEYWFQFRLSGYEDITFILNECLFTIFLDDEIGNKETNKVAFRNELIWEVNDEYYKAVIGDLYNLDPELNENNLELLPSSLLFPESPFHQFATVNTSSNLCFDFKNESLSEIFERSNEDYEKVVNKVSQYLFSVFKIFINRRGLKTSS
jgi:hypothetical protein